MLKEIKEVGKRGVIFQYEDQNLVYLINGSKRLYLCDTHLGFDSMQAIKNYIKNKGYQAKELVIFNSHSDYDHNWGNGAFNDNLIVAHQSNLARFKMIGEYELEMKSKFKNGKVELVYPNLTFEKKLNFTDDKIEFIYAPGHTVDSTICIDKVDNTAYIGDLVEAPIPMILWHNLNKFIESLEYLKSLSVERYIASHSGIISKKLINENINYLRKILSGDKINFEDSRTQRIHNFNQKNILINEFEAKARCKLGPNFNYKKFKINFWKELGVKEIELTDEFNYILKTNKENLQKAFQKYFNSIKM